MAGLLLPDAIWQRRRMREISLRLGTLKRSRKWRMIRMTKRNCKKV
jgi:hypothetical protein